MHDGSGGAMVRCTVFAARGRGLSSRHVVAACGGRATAGNTAQGRLVTQDADVRAPSRRSGVTSSGASRPTQGRTCPAVTRSTRREVCPGRR